jgi:arylformamidase
MHVIDISLMVSGTLPVWPGDPSVELHLIESIEEGAQANVSHLSMGAHTGTHVDAPHHFLNDGRTVEGLPLNVLTGPCYVVELQEEVNRINEEVLQGISFPEGVTRLLFRTRNSRLWNLSMSEFTEDYVAIDPSGAQRLVEEGIQLVGEDYLSVAPYGESIPTHTILLKAGIILVEGLDLSTVPGGSYTLYCLPLKLLGADGAPARAILIGA